MNDIVRAAAGALTGRHPALRTALAAIAVAAIGVVAAGPVSAEPPQITERRAQAQAVLAEIQSLDHELGSAIEAYNGASEQLSQIERERALNSNHLVIAKRNLSISQRRLGERLRAIYMFGDDDSTLAVLLGASSLANFLGRIETIQSVAAQDTQVLGEVTRFKRDVTRRAAQLKVAHERQTKVVAERAATKQRIEAGLAERRRLVASIKDEITRLEAEERVRQERLRREAAQRLAAQQAAQERALAADQIQSVVGASAVSPDETVSVVPPSQYTGVVGIAMQYLGCRTFGVAHLPRGSTVRA